MDNFIETFKKAEITSNEIKNKKKKEVLKKAMNYTKFRHFKSLSKIIDLIKN